MLSEEIGRTGTILLVAEADSVVGYALGWVLLDELQVLRLAVLPTLRRQGQGRQLLHALEAASGASDSWLEVRDDNVAAIALYERTGYTQISRRPRYYHDGCAARIYKKGLGLYPSPS